MNCGATFSKDRKYRYTLFDRVPKLKPILEDRDTYALRIGKTGMPTHPLYLPAELRPIPYKI